MELKPRKAVRKKQFDKAEIVKIDSKKVVVQNDKGKSKFENPHI